MPSPWQPVDRTQVRGGASCAKDEDDQTWLVQSGGYRGTQGATRHLASAQGRSKEDGQTVSGGCGWNWV